MNRYIKKFNESIDIDLKNLNIGSEYQLSPIGSNDYDNFRVIDNTNNGYIFLDIETGYSVRFRFNQLEKCYINKI